MAEVTGIFSRQTTELLKLAKEARARELLLADPTFDLETKLAFVDPQTMAPPDPAAAGGAPAGAPAPDPMVDQLMSRLNSLEQQLAAQGGGAGGAGGAAGVLKPKVDVNVVLMQILKIVTRLAEANNVHVPPSDLVPTANDVTQLAQMSQTGNFAAASQPSAIAPIEPIQPAMPQGAGDGGGGEGGKQAAFRQGVPYDMGEAGNRQLNLSARATALSRLFNAENGGGY